MKHASTDLTESLQSSTPPWPPLVPLPFKGPESGLGLFRGGPYGSISRFVDKNPSGSLFEILTRCQQTHDSNRKQKTSFIEKHEMTREKERERAVKPRTEQDAGSCAQSE